MGKKKREKRKEKIIIILVICIEFYNFLTLSSPLIFIINNGGVCFVVACFLTPWNVARQVPLSMRFSQKEYWSGL